MKSDEESLTIESGGPASEAMWPSVKPGVYVAIRAQRGSGSGFRCRVWTLVRSVEEGVADVEVLAPPASLRLDRGHVLRIRPTHVAAVSLELPFNNSK